ncbi:MAG: hypothetical protein ACU843_08625 [Gammaproteobacteria bacterium]
MKEGMSIEKLDFDSIEESDLQEFVDAEVTEGPRIEFKSPTYKKTDEDKHELLKNCAWS